MVNFLYNWSNWYGYAQWVSWKVEWLTHIFDIIDIIDKHTKHQSNLNLITYQSLHIQIEDSRKACKLQNFGGNCQQPNFL